MESKAIEKKSLDFAVVGKYIVFLLAIHFFFFGYISNTYNKTPGDKLLFVFLAMFDFQAKYWYFSLLVIILCVVVMAFSEDFLMVAVKKALWAGPYIIISSILWYWWNYYFFVTYNDNDAEIFYDYYGESIGGANRMKFFQPLISYFGSYKGYLNILVVMIILGGSAILGGFLKIKYRERFKKRSVDEI